MAFIVNSFLCVPFRPLTVLETSHIFLWQVSYISFESSSGTKSPPVS